MSKGKTKKKKQSSNTVTKNAATASHCFSQQVIAVICDVFEILDEKKVDLNLQIDQKLAINK